MNELKVNGEKSKIAGEEVVKEKMVNKNPGIPEITKVQVGALCTLALPVKPAHQGSPCHFCGKEVEVAAKPEHCPERPMIVGHFNKMFKLASVRDGGDTIILKRQY